MKKINILLLVSLLCSVGNLYSQSVKLTERYFQISVNGEVDTTKIEEERYYFFKGKELIEAKSKVDGLSYNLNTYVDKHNSLLRIDDNNGHTVKNDQGQIITYRYIKGESIYTHHYSYDSWGNLEKDELVIKAGEQIKKKNLTFEYFYLSEFSYATNKKGVKAISGYENNYNSLWVKKSVKEDGRLVEYAERKIQESNNSALARLGRKFLKVIGYGYTER
ncbi:hypothetical protein FUAX_41130 (plasmid) [Fulvitalea axinellae]|uniref:YD repeat-containing protein n=2 Tax=Fulvitalea axinellae TaxID=1182444 RepID=A0AAU9DER1_9BACT|nr:hypothetical protein FUAX_41130 [Fulvitalea axinellae]